MLPKLFETHCGELSFELRGYGSAIPVISPICSEISMQQRTLNFDLERDVVLRQCWKNDVIAQCNNT